MECWVVLARSKDDRMVPTTCAQSEEAAYELAKEAVDSTMLLLSVGASEEQIAEAQAVFDSIEVRRVRLDFLDG